MIVMVTMVLPVDLISAKLEGILVIYLTIFLVEDSAAVQVGQEQKEVQQEYLEQICATTLKLPWKMHLKEYKHLYIM